MSAGMPTSKIVEIKSLVTPGVWTDVSADVDWPDTVPITTRGRTSPYGSTQSAGITVSLDNSTGKYTPFRQVLADGVTANPNYPHIMPRLPLRYSYISGGITYIRFVGAIRSWTPVMEGNTLGHVIVAAADRFDQLNKVTLGSPIYTETDFDNPLYQWRLTEPAGAVSAIEAGGGPPMLLAGAGPALTFGDNGPGYGDGTGIKFAPASSSSGQLLRVFTSLTLTAFTIEIWVNTNAGLPAWASGGGTENILGLCDSAGTLNHGLYLFNGAPSYEDGFANSVNASASIGTNNGWHHIAVTRTSGTGVVTLYVDGVNAGVTASGAGFAQTSTLLSVGDWIAPNSFVPARFQGNIGYVGIYPVALSAARIQAHAAATFGYVGDTSAVRVSRFLGADGLTSADWNLDPGAAIINTYPQAGKPIPQACQDMAVTESGGAAVYIATDGRVRFCDRHFRKAAAPALTIDAVTDLDGNVFAGSVDDMSLVNVSIGNRATLSGTQTTQTVTNAASVAAFGYSDDGGFDSYSMTDLDVIEMAQWRVALGYSPGYRLAQLAVDLAAAENNLYASFATVEIGSRLRVTSLAPAAAPASQMDFIVEGWTETPDDSHYQVLFDLSPADNPAFGIYGDATYGDYQADPGTTLNTTITSAGTTVIIATTGAVFTSAGGSYPFNIQINAEIMTLNSAPGGSTSPQTFTGVTRGVLGTAKAAQTAGAVVTLFPVDCYAL